MVIFAKQLVSIYEYSQVMIEWEPFVSTTTRPCTPPVATIKCLKTRWKTRYGKQAFRNPSQKLLFRLATTIYWLHDLSRVVQYADLMVYLSVSD